MPGYISLTVQCLQCWCLLGCGGDLQRRESSVRNTTHANITKLPQHKVSDLQELCILFCNFTVDQDQYIHTFFIHTERLKNAPLHHWELRGRSWILQYWRKNTKEAQKTKTKSRAGPQSQRKQCSLHNQKESLEFGFGFKTQENIFMELEPSAYKKQCSSCHFIMGQERTQWLTYHRPHGKCTRDKFF